MICTSIGGKTLAEIYEILDDPFVEMAEIRLDLCKLTDSQIEELFGSVEKPLIATCRASLCRDYAHKLELAATAGARYVDLDLDAPAEVSKKFRNLCADCGSELIRSHHFAKGASNPGLIAQTASRALRYGADIVKIVTDGDPSVLDLYANLPATGQTGNNPSAQTDAGSNAPVVPAGRLVAFAMGEDCADTRLECLRRGAPFSYACLSAAEATAPGQMDYDTMHRTVYGDFNGFFRTDLAMPASKSFAQRAILAAAVAEGTSHLRHYTPCDDSEAAISLAKTLGAKVRRTETEDGWTLTIQGAGLKHGLNSAEDGASNRRDKNSDKCDKERQAKGNYLNLTKIDTGESGLLTRMAIPLVAALNEAPEFEVHGSRTLLNRPLHAAADIMASFGVMLTSLKPAADRAIRVPLKVSGGIIPGTAEVSGQGGSQLISGLLMALPLCGKGSKLYVSEPKSIPYMFITLDVLRRFGVRISNEMEGDARLLENQDWSGCDQISFNIKGGQSYKAADFDIEGDWSAAACFLVAGAIYGSAEIQGLDTKSLQADISIMDVLVQAGASVSFSDADVQDGVEVPSVVSVRKSALEGFEVDLSNAPDLFPTAAVLAAFCSGESRLAGVSRLVAKESNRAETVQAMLRQMGVPVRVEEDEMVISGEPLARRILCGHLPASGEYDTHCDHRLAMALAIAAISNPAVTILGCDCVSKSFPDFWETLR